MEEYQYMKESKLPIYNMNRKSSFEKIDKILGFILKAVGLLLCILTVLVQQQTLSKSIEENQKKNMVVKEFTYYTGKEFKNVQYYGKSNVFKSVLRNIKKLINDSETKSDAVLSKITGVNDRNYLFYGPPGTGKTLFIKKLTYLLNEEFEKQFGEKTEGYVRAYLITPSDINDKWHGETERKIKTLFKEARENKTFKATFIFIDEIDAFFSNRETAISEHANNHKTEFLNFLSGINEDLRANVFFMGATNRVNVLDPAFLRRLGRSIGFFLPNKKEIVIMLNEISKDWLGDKNAHDFNNIANILAKREASQSLIYDICRSLVNTFGADKNNLRELLISLVKETNQYVNQLPIDSTDLKHEQLTKNNLLKFNYGHFMDILDGSRTDE